MLCQREGCGEHFRGNGQSVLVKVKDSRKKQVPERKERWCLTCASVLEPNKYTLEYFVEGTKLKMRRIQGPSLESGGAVLPGERLEDQAPIVKPQINLSDAAQRKKVLKKRRKAQKKPSFIEAT